MEFCMQYKGIVIREYKRSDLNGVHQMLSSPQVYKTTCAIPYNCNRTYALLWIDNIRKSLKKRTDFEFGIFDAESGEYIGNIGLISVSYINKSADLTYIITPKYQHRGYALTAAKLMIAYGFERLGLIRIHAKCMDFNIASRRVMEKCGFSYEGTGRNEMYKDEKAYDLVHYSLLKNEYLSLKGSVFFSDVFFPAAK